MRGLIRRIALWVGTFIAFSLFLLTTALAAHRISWIPESIRDALHLDTVISDDRSSIQLLTGPVGPVGPVGPQGEVGEAGQAGAPGEQGRIGPVGPIGKTGKSGPQGKQGVPGIKGDRGDAGPVGPTGAQGAQGAQGVQGEPGIKGDRGEMGPAGSVGPQGPQGPTGQQGLQGLQGPQGEVGPVGPIGATGIQGVPGVPGLLQGIYGSYLDTTNQLNTNPGQPIAMQLNTVVSQRQVSVANGSKVTVGVKGTYNIAFSAQMFHTANEASTADIWLRVNGNDVPDSNTQFTFERKDDKYVAAWNFMIDLNANDFVQLMWFSNDSTVRISYSGIGASPTRPAIPSLILTINQVG